MPVLIFGLLTSVWSGQRAFVGMQAALDDLAEVGIDERANLAVKRLRALIGIVVVALAQVLTAVLSGFAGPAGSPDQQGRGGRRRVRGQLRRRGGGVELALAAPVTWATVRPGAVFAGILFTVLQLIGVAVVGRTIAEARGSTARSHR